MCVYAGLGFLFLILDVTVPVQTVKHFLYYFLSPTTVNASKVLSYSENSFWRFGELVRLYQKNRLLESQLQSHITLEAQTATLKAENERLNNLLGFVPLPSYKAVPSRVIFREHGSWYDTILLGHGAAAGITVNAPVVAISGKNTGLIGRVVEVNRNSAKVKLLTSNSSATTASIIRIGEIGAIRGSGNPVFSLDYIAAEAGVQDGDLITSAGLGGYYPAGLPIGRVTRVKLNNNGMFKAIQVAPMVSYGKILEVVVLVPNKS